MMNHPAQRNLSLAQRALELKRLDLPNSEVKIWSGRELHYKFTISPSHFSRSYECLLRVTPDARIPDLIVLSPDLELIAENRKLPHIYTHKEKGTKLCLWYPRKREWLPQMKFTDTFIPWTAEWLWYFEDWLYTGVWAGGGVHPD